MDRNFHRFRSAWDVVAAPSLAYSVLERFTEYPAWWPEIRHLRPVGEEACEVICRPVLPYELVMVLRPSRRDPDGHVLEASMTGDLEGFSRWSVTASPTGHGSQVVFDEEVVVKPLLRRLGPIARPAMRANHTLMMRHAKRGLATRLAGIDEAGGDMAPWSPPTYVETDAGGTDDAVGGERPEEADPAARSR